MLELIAEKKGARMWIFAQGSIDSTTEGDLVDFVARLLQSGERDLVLELTGVELVAANGLRAIMVINRDAREMGGAFSLASVPASIMDNLRFVGLDKVLKFEGP